MNLLRFKQIYINFKSLALIKIKTKSLFIYNLSKFRNKQIKAI